MVCPLIIFPFYERHFFPFGTHVQYQRVGLTHHLISHRLSLFYCQDTLKAFFRDFGIYHTQAVTHNNATFIFTTFMNSELLWSFENVNLVYFALIYSLLFNISSISINIQNVRKRNLHINPNSANVENMVTP